MRCGRCGLQTVFGLCTSCQNTDRINRIELGGKFRPGELIQSLSFPGDDEVVYLFTNYAGRYVVKVDKEVMILDPSRVTN